MICSRFCFASHHACSGRLDPYSSVNKNHVDLTLRRGSNVRKTPTKYGMLMRQNSERLMRQGCLSGWVTLWGKEKFILII
ncbi:hypothetical protein V6N13_010196 [Hibiscus sabdariffa]